MKAKDIMTANVISVSPDTTVEKIAQIFVENRISGVPVVDSNNNLLGIISEGDLVYKQKKISTPTFFAIFDGVVQLGRQAFFEELQKIAAYKAEDIMIKKVISVDPEEEVEDIATEMINHNIKRIPVIDQNNKLQGIITRYDIIKHIYVK